MTIDDENSVYVGGLPYDATEDTLRKAFDLYGRVVVVKIVNDRGVGGKCYGFVTFTNPRAATNAINDMNGRKIDGRVVKVSEVKTRGRSNFARESFKRNPERGTDWDRGRDRDRTDDRDRRRDRHRERSLNRSQDRERGYNRIRDLDRTRDRVPDRDRGRDQHGDDKDMEQEHDRNDERPQDRDSNFDRYHDKEGEQSRDHRRSEEKDRGPISRLLNGSDANDNRSKEPSSEFIGGDENQYQVEQQLGFSAQRLEELKSEVSQIEGLIEEKKEYVTNLQEKSQSLEAALSRAKRRTSQCQGQLTKLHKSYLQTKEYSDKLKSSEEELQSLVDSTMIDIEYGDNGGPRKGVLANGNA